MKTYENAMVYKGSSKTTENRMLCLTKVWKDMNIQLCNKVVLIKCYVWVGLWKNMKNAIE